MATLLNVITSEALEEEQLEQIEMPKKRRCYLNLSRSWSSKVHKKFDTTLLGYYTEHKVMIFDHAS
jgi:hypothetical protein